MTEPSGHNYTDRYRDDPIEEEHHSSSVSHSSASSTARHIELTQRTNELLSNFGNFLNELGDPANPSPPNGEFGDDEALQSPRSGANNGGMNAHSYQTSSYTDRGDDDVSYQPAGGGPNLWNTTEYYDYDADRKKLYRYRLMGGNNLAYVCTFGVIIALVVIAAVSIGGKNKEKPPPTTATVFKDPMEPEGSSLDVNAGETTLDEEEDLLLSLDKSYMPQDPNLKELYLAIAETFRPQWYSRREGWEGQAYLQAYDFCSAQGQMQPCPYTALCPAGVGQVPYGGVREAPNANSNAWAPVKNRPNEWVQVSYSPEKDEEDGGICELFSSSHIGTPRWGLTGESDEELTEHILCCLVDEAIMADEAEAFTHEMSQGVEMGSGAISRPPDLEEDQTGDVIESNNDKQETSEKVDSETGKDEPASSSGGVPALDSRVPNFTAFWYSRSDGWEGTTYQAAVDFCETHDEQSLCPFQYYCPDGPGGVPFAADAQQALLEYDSLFWSPVMNGAGEEAWGGIGSANRCVPPQQHPRVSPEMLYNATSFIMCCNMNTGASNGQSSPSATSEETTDTTETSEEMAMEIVEEVEEFTESEFMKAAYEMWNPVWFTADDGWNGGSYAKAIGFCNEHLEEGELCPYQALCPNGLDTNPYLSQKIPALALDQWVPTRNSVFSYILIEHGAEKNDSKGGAKCDSFENIHGSRPVYGTTEEMQEYKQYLLCCHHYEG